MLIATLSEVSKSFGSQDVLDHVHWQIPENARLALVGRNGSGKTTLFRILTGELEPDQGTVWRAKGAVVVTMEQEVRVEDERTLREEAARGLQHIQALHEEFATVTRELGGIREGDPEGKELLDRYAHLQERLEREGGYGFEARIREILAGLHFEEEDLDRPLAEFSGGQKSRAMLARVLLRDPDLLLLDEPTNHLDLEATEWLETFLNGYGGAFVVVSHDRMFLNRLARGVAELRFHRLHHFPGNYDDFLVERERRLEEHAKRYELQQAEIARQEDFVRRNIAGQKTKQAQARRKMLEKLERIPPPEWPASSIHMTLPEASRTAKIVVDAKDLAKGYDGRPVFMDVTFQIVRGQKVGLIGPNGVGKTTLVRLLVGEEGQDRGTLRIGSGVQIGYQEQEQKRLTGSRSVLDEIWQITPQTTENEIRGFLGGFLFRGDDVFKPLNALSGGEKSRVALARLVRQGANFLVLDEPTNHLDIESREVMEAALQAFGGTVLAVSHDRYFLDQVADHILALGPGGCRLWEGGYSRYAETGKPPAAPRPEAGEPAEPPKPGSQARISREPRKGPSEYEEQKRRKREEERLRRRLADAESAVGTLEEAKESLRLHMADPELATNAEELGALNAKLQDLETEVMQAIQEWEAADRRLHAFLDGAN